MTYPDYVWYACYGSNLCRERLMIYISGGRLPGGEREYPGARNDAPPSDDRPFTIGHSLYFAHRSSAWNGGGVAFVRVQPSPDAATYARLYRITGEQFSDIFGEENRYPDFNRYDWREILTKPSTSLLGNRWYGTILNFGKLNDEPVLTFTWDPRRAAIPYNPPNASYLQRIAAGLSACHGLPHGAIVDYLANREGIRGALAREEVERMLEVDLPLRLQSDWPSRGNAS